MWGFFVEGAVVLVVVVEGVGVLLLPPLLLLPSQKFERKKSASEKWVPSQRKERAGNRTSCSQL